MCVCVCGFGCFNLIITEVVLSDLHIILKYIITTAVQKAYELIIIQLRVYCV